MKALTIQQPWAWAIVAGWKPVENRVWTTAYRGPLAIHAGQTYDGDGEDLIRATIPHQDWPDFGALPRGAVIGMATISGICSRFLSADPPICGCDPAWQQPGLYHWAVGDSRWLREPVACRGRQRLWDVPAGVRAEFVMGHYASQVPA